MSVHSLDDLLDELHRLADGDTPPTTTAMRKHGTHSPSTYRDRFGSWNNAVEQAGFTPRTGRISDEELLNELHRLADGDTPPTTTAMQTHGNHSPNTYRNRFGSWTTAVEQAGLTPRTRRISDEELLDEIHRLADSDIPPTTTAMQNHGNYSLTTYNSRFGSWHDALKQAGFTRCVRPPTEHVTTDDLLAELIRVSTNEVAPTQDKMKEQGMYNPSLYTSKFGSWTTALTRAGLDLREPGRQTKTWEYAHTNTHAPTDDSREYTSDHP